ncbi:MAG: acyl-CoA thioesterase [Pseudomonadota bacterium]
MYPWLRLVARLRSARRLPPAGLLDTHVSQHRVSLFDCDMFAEMNNGRILTIYEFGRWEMSTRTGLWAAIRKRGWGFAVAGASVRYRKRLTPWEKFEMRTRVVGWDARFVYIEQGMFKANGDCANHCLFRTAVVSKGRAVPTADLVEVMDFKGPAPVLPAWAQAWIDADTQRPWPPMAEDPSVSLAA